MASKHTIRSLKNRKHAFERKPLQMLTCYDFQTAQLLNETELDLILVGDSLGNVILGYETTVQVTLNDMITFGSAVKRGAPDKFTVVDLPFGTYSSVETGIKNAIKLFQKTSCEAIKLEGAFDYQCELITRLTENGVPVMGHIGLTPQSVHQLGGYYTHGKNQLEQDRLLKEALKLQQAGVFALVLECVEKKLSEKITQSLHIPTIGIGAGEATDGQVLVTNDLLKMGPQMPPKFCQPIADLYQLKKDLINQYLNHDKTEENRIH